MPRLLRPAIACLLAAAAGLAQAKVESFELDPVHTRVAFRIDHAGFSRAIGTFSGATGTLDFDPDDWSTATLDVTLPLATLDIGDDELARQGARPHLPGRRRTACGALRLHPRRARRARPGARRTAS